MYETSRQSRFDARYWMLGAGALGRPRGIVWGGRREEGSEWGTHVYLWQIHFDIWQNQYNIVKLKNKIKLKKIFLMKFWNNRYKRVLMHLLIVQYLHIKILHSVHVPALPIQAQELFVFFILKCSIYD